MRSSTVRLLDLKPSQFSLGMLQVRSKMAKASALNRGAFAHLIANTPITVVRGPASHFHVIDHHHWARAWIELGVDAAPVDVHADFSHLSSDDFVSQMHEHGWLHPFNERGDRVADAALPGSIADMADDPYLSLAAFLRMAGVYENPGEFNAKFAWADYLRNKVSGDFETVEGFAAMLASSFKCAGQRDACSLPGRISDEADKRNS